jgi:hypothetical protein
LAKSGHEPFDDIPIPTRPRFFCRDPVGNLIEFTRTESHYQSTSSISRRRGFRRRYSPKPDFSRKNDCRSMIQESIYRSRSSHSNATRGAGSKSTFHANRWSTSYEGCIRAASRLGADPVRRWMGSSRMAGRLLRGRRHPGGVLALRRGVRESRCSGSGQPERPRDARSHANGIWDAVSNEPAPTEAGWRRSYLGAGAV